MAIIIDSLIIDPLIYGVACGAALGLTWELWWNLIQFITHRLAARYLLCSWQGHRREGWAYCQRCHKRLDRIGWP